MKNQVNRQFRLKARPETRVGREHFDLVEAPVPEPADGQYVARTLYLSLDPTNRIWMSDRDQYMTPVALGDVMRGGGIAQVVASRNPKLQVGDLVQGLTGWQDYVLVDPADPMPPGKLPKDLPVPLTALMGPVGMTGVTAWCGLLNLTDPKPGETVVVSAAAGAVGSIVGQIVKIKGARAVGIAGSADKCRWVVDDLGFDACINYRDADWVKQLEAACPNGIDVDFENVGGPIMDEVWAHMNLFGRVALCGLISGYNSEVRMQGNVESILMKRLSIRGFIVTDFAPDWPKAQRDLATWVAEGRIKYRETIVEGLENAPEAVNLLFDGGNTGKLMIKVADQAV